MPAGERRSPRTSSELGDVLDVVALVERLGVAAARLLQPLERRRPGRLDLVEQLVDRLVARRRDADRLPARDQVGDQPAATSTSCPSRAGPGSRGGGRRASGRAPSSRRGRSSGRRARTARAAGSTRAPDSDGRRRAASGRSARARPPGRLVSYGPPGISARGSGTSASDRAALQPSDPLFAVELDELRRRLRPSPDRTRRLTDASLCSCGGKVNVYTIDCFDRLGLADRLEPADRLGVLDAAPPASCSSRSKNAHQTGLALAAW